MKCILVTFTPLSSSPTHPRSTLTSLPTQLNTLFYLSLITHRIQLWCLNELLYGAIHWSMINLLGDTSSKKNLGFPSPEAITSISGEFMVRPLSMLDSWMAWSFAGHLSCGEFKSCYVQKTLTHSSIPWPLALICLPPMMTLDPGEMDDVVGSYMIQMSHLWLSSTVHLFSALWTVIIFYVNYHPPHQETSLRRSESFIYNIWV